MALVGKTREQTSVDRNTGASVATAHRSPPTGTSSSTATTSPFLSFGTPSVGSGPSSTTTGWGGGLRSGGGGGSSAGQSISSGPFDQQRREMTTWSGTRAGGAPPSGAPHQQYTHMAYFQEAVVSAKEWSRANLGPAEIQTLSEEEGVSIDVHTHPLTGRVDVIFAADTKEKIDMVTQNLGYAMGTSPMGTTLHFHPSIIEVKVPTPFDFRSVSMSQGNVQLPQYQETAANSCGVPSGVIPPPAVVAPDGAAHYRPAVAMDAASVAMAVDALPAVSSGAKAGPVGVVPPAASKNGALTVAEYRLLWASPGREGEW